MHRVKKAAKGHLKVKVVSSANFIVEQPPVSDEAFQHALQVVSDPKNAEAFLKKAGIIVRAGKLHPNYS